jgi:imidazoleglycerol phosphate synthase glutamine amidotransferase subunit HisH
MAREVTIVDAGLGNLASVERALVQVGAAVRVSGDPDKVATARMVVFPGQGAFGAATQSIVDGALGAALRMVIERGDPFLGICLGMQMLFDASDENGGCEGLHILGGHCRRFPTGVFEDAEPGATAPTDPIRAVEPKLTGKSSREPMADSIAAALETEAERVVTTSFAADGDDPPSSEEAAPVLQNGPGSDLPPPPEIPPGPEPPIGGVRPPMLEAPVIEPAPPPPPAPIAAAPVEAADLEPLRRRVKVPHVGWNSVEPTGEHYYFVHSYFVEPARAEDVMWMATYGGIRFPAAVRHQNVLGCQFHPEKSQRSGLKFLRAFLLGGWG